MRCRWLLAARPQRGAVFSVDCGHNSTLGLDVINVDTTITRVHHNQGLTRKKFTTTDLSRESAKVVRETRAVKVSSIKKKIVFPFDRYPFSVQVSTWFGLSKKTVGPAG